MCKVLLQWTKNYGQMPEICLWECSDCAITPSCTAQQKNEQHLNPIYDICEMHESIKDLTHTYIYICMYVCIHNYITSFLESYMYHVEIDSAYAYNDSAHWQVASRWFSMKMLIWRWWWKNRVCDSLVWSPVGQFERWRDGEGAMFLSDRNGRKRLIFTYTY